MRYVIAEAYWHVGIGPGAQLVGLLELKSERNKCGKLLLLKEPCYPLAATTASAGLDTPLLSYSSI